MTPSAIIREVQVATVQGQLPEPVVFGDWIMNTREYAVVRVLLESGIEGWSFSLTRDGAVAEQIRKTISNTYKGSTLDAREMTYKIAKGRSLASHSAGTGLRAMSLVDLAVWDAAAKTAGESISSFLGGARSQMPATAIVGYPPASMGPEQVFQQVTKLYADGWRRFKAPIGASPEISAERLRAIRRAAPDAWIGCDAAWVYSNVQSAVAFLNSIEDVKLDWFEDIFPPGNAQIVAELRQRTSVPIAMGDEQGGLYYPEALISKNAVDVIRIDLTCMGGITGGKQIVSQCLREGVEFAPHMFAHVHSQVFSGWGFSDVPIEWGVPWTGVDPYADSLIQPVISAGGVMEPLPEELGFGNLVNLEWIRSQPLDDPDNIFDRA